MGEGIFPLPEQPIIYRAQGESNEREPPMTLGGSQPGDGDGGNRTRVRRVRQETSYKLSRLLGLAPCRLNRRSWYGASRSLRWEGLSHPYRHQGDCTPADMTPVSAPPEANAERTWPLSVARALPTLLRLRGYGVSIRRCSCCVGTCQLPLFYEARHLSLQSRVSPPRRSLSSP